MRNKKVYNHPDLAYIIKLLKKDTPYLEIEKRVNKRGKGEPLTRHSIARFARDYAKDLEQKTGSVIKKINELKEEEPPAVMAQAELYIEEELIPATETLELLFNNAVAKTQIVLDEVINKERDMRDFKTYIDAINAINDLRNELAEKSPAALTGSNAYENYILDIDFNNESGETEEGAHGEH